MSETVIYIGKVKEILPNENESLIDLCKRICEEYEYDVDDNANCSRRLCGSQKKIESKNV